jgi:hypothetical protein
MKLKTFCAGLLAFILLTPLAKGDPPVELQNLGANAALKYWAGFFLMPDSKSDLAIIDDWQKVPLDAAAVKTIESGRVSLDYLHAGAEIPDCDWGIDPNQGLGLLLPHLNKVRQLAKLACLRARYEFQQGDQAAAVDDLCDALVCARYAGRGPTVVCTLVQFGMEREAIECLASGLDKLDDNSLKHLSERLDQLPWTGTLAESVEGEKQIFVNWLIKRVRDVAENSDWSPVFSFLRGDDAHFDGAALVRSAGGTSDAVVHQLQLLSSFYDEMAKLISSHPSQDEFRQKDAELIRQFSTNPFAKILLPALDRTYDLQAANLTRMILLKAAIAVKENGPEALKDFQDPIGHQPLLYHARPGGGFTLSSKVTDRNQPVALTV